MAKKKIKSSKISDNKVQVGKTRIKATSEERRLAAKAIVDKGKEQGLEIIPTKDGFGGFVTMTGKDESTTDVRWSVGEDGYVHMAGVIPDNLRTGYDYLQQAEEYDSVDRAQRKEVINLSRRAVKYEGVVNTSIEALVEIPTLGGWFIYCENEELETLLYYWAKNFGVIGDESAIETGEDNVQRPGGIELFALNMLWTLYRDGDAVITEQWDNVRVAEVGNKRRNLPTSYIEHDIAACEIPEAFYKMGKELIICEPDAKIQELLEAGGETDLEKKIIEQIPDSIKESYKQLDKYDGKVLLPPEFTTHFSRKADNRSPWGMPYVVKAFSALSFKHRLRDLDNATIEGLIQRIWIIKVGHDDPTSDLHIPHNDRVLLAIGMFKQLQTNNFAVWGGPDLETEEFGSSEKNILSLTDRYKSADDDIRVALGVPKALTAGEGSGSSKDFSVYVKVISQMERYHIMLKNWIDHKMRQIAVENNYKKEFPSFHWQFLKMQDREKAKNLITKLWEDNLIGRRMSLNYLGFPAWMVIRDQQREKEEGLKDTIDPAPIPFTGPQDRQDIEDDDGENPKSKPSDPDSDREGK